MEEEPADRAGGGAIEPLWLPLLICSRPICGDGVGCMGEGSLVGRFLPENICEQVSIPHRDSAQRRAFL